MEKRISISQFRSIKLVAKAVNPLVEKKNRLKKQIEGLAAEYKSLQDQIGGMEHGVLAMTGFQSEDLVKKIVEPTGKVDKDGKPIKVTKYVPTSIVTKDEEKNEYVITLPVFSDDPGEKKEEAPAEEKDAAPAEDAAPISFEEEQPATEPEADVF